jgi:hypothetical protein
MKKNHKKVNVKTSYNLIQNQRTKLLWSLQSYKLIAATIHTPIWRNQISHESINLSVKMAIEYLIRLSLQVLIIRTPTIMLVTSSIINSTLIIKATLDNRVIIRI